MHTQTQQIIPYTREQLQWHLTGNVFGLTTNTIERIIGQCEGLNEGLYDLNDEVAPDTGISFAEMLDDLKIDYNA